MVKCVMLPYVSDDDRNYSLHILFVTINYILLYTVQQPVFENK